MDPMETTPSAPPVSTELPPSTAAAPPPQHQPPQQPLASSSSTPIPSTPEPPAPSPSTPSSSTNPPIAQSRPQLHPQSQQRPVPPSSLVRGSRPPQPPFTHFPQHISTASSSSVSSSLMPPPSIASSPAPIQRGGVAIGVPAHHPPRAQQQGGPVPFPSFGPAPSFGQPFGGMPPRSTVGLPDQTSNSSSQVRPPIQGVQTIGVLGSLSTPSHTRPTGVSAQHQQRPGQQPPPLRSILATINQPIGTQKLSNQSLMRVSSMGSTGSPTPGLPQSSQPLQQSWMAAQGKQVQASSLPSSSYRPQVRPQSLQQRSLHPQPVSSVQQQQQNQQLQQKQQQPQKQQQQQQTSLPHQLLGQQTQQQQPQIQQTVLQQQPISRNQGLASQKVQSPATGQPGTIHPGAVASVANVDDAETGNQILSKRSIHELVTQVDPTEKLDPEVEDILVEIADDFIESITTVACSLAKHRKSTTLEAKDILLHLERNWNMTLPGFGGDEMKCYKKPITNDIHKERLAVIKKSMAGMPETGNLKNTNAGQSTAHVKSHAAKLPVVGSPKLQ